MSCKINSKKHTAIDRNLQLLSYEFLVTVTPSYQRKMSAYPLEYDAKGNPTQMKLYATDKEVKKATPSYVDAGTYQYEQAEPYSYEDMSKSSSHKSSSKDTKQKSSSSKNKKK
ncbi:hypothetical protein F5Y12DRAFT_717621 [Xylaria sp. FL1777]|nr:hypothetical protein F5Y12DRAFT_717621 [Xylaria sp. FL1777]